MTIIDQGTVIPSGEGTERQSLTFPGICVHPDGTWLVACRAARKKQELKGQHIIVTRSEDQGKSWSQPEAPYAPPELEGRPGLFRTGYITYIDDRHASGNERPALLNVLCWVDHSRPELVLFNEENEGLLDCKVFISRSDDCGRTWGEPYFADMSPYTMPTPLTGPILPLKNGELACQIELNKHYDDNTPWHHSSVLLFSKDGGRTWGESSRVTGDPENRVFYWDQRPAVLSDGSLLDVFWTFDRETAEYLPIHYSRSRDNGRTWTYPEATEVPGQPAQPVDLPDGRVIMVYVDRTKRPILKARASSDGGVTWPESTETILFDRGPENQTVKKGSMQDAWSEMGKFSLGLPATAALPGGEVLTVFYNGPVTDQTSIQYVRFKP
jgi:hypothetical protein